MTELFINTPKTCAISGHRRLPENFDRENLKRILTEFVKRDFDTFLIGMALGFDTVCFNILEELRKEYKINLIACVPCLNQDYNFTSEQKKEYLRMLNSANQVVYVNRNYSKYCMSIRNRFMVDNASVLICYLRQNFGGTYSTKKYAEKSGKLIYMV